MRYDTINFTNIDSEDFDGKWGGEEYLIKAGKTKEFPAFLAEHLTKHLVDKILLKRGSQDYSDPTARKPLEDQIKGSVVIKEEVKDVKMKIVSVKKGEPVEEPFKALKKKKNK